MSRVEIVGWRQYHTRESVVRDKTEKSCNTSRRYLRVSCWFPDSQSSPQCCRYLLLGQSWSETKCSAGRANGGGWTWRLLFWKHKETDACKFGYSVVDEKITVVGNCFILILGSLNEIYENANLIIQNGFRQCLLFFGKDYIQIIHNKYRERQQRATPRKVSSCSQSQLKRGWAHSSITSMTHIGKQPFTLRRMNSSVTKPKQRVFGLWKPT